LFAASTVMAAVSAGSNRCAIGVLLATELP
jgi:hypothetical protein